MANAEQLYNQALESIAFDDTDEAIQLLSQAVDADNDYLPAWLKLAEIMPDSDAKYDVLEQVMRLDSDNSFAQSEWDRLNTNFTDNAEAEVAAAKKVKRQKRSDDEFMPGITRREARFVSIGLGLFTGLMCILTFLVINIVNGRTAQEVAVETQRAVNRTQTVEAVAQVYTATAAVQTEVALALTETAAITITPPDTPTFTPAFQLPTEIPDTPTPTPVQLRVYPAPLAELNLSGRILAWGGFNPSSSEFLQLRLYNVTDGERADRNMVSPVNQLFVKELSTDAIGGRIVGISTNPRTGDLYLISLDGSNFDADEVRLSDAWFAQLNTPQSPVLSLTGNQLVFTAFAQSSGHHEVFLYTFSSEELVQLTDDEHEYPQAAISGNGNQVVAVRENPAGTDLILIDVLNEEFPQRPLTDNGNEQIEGSPRFAPNSANIVFTVATTDSRDHDIHVLDMNLLENTALIATDADEITPTFSPDSRYLAYAADVTGQYNVFIYDTLTQLTFQLTAQGREPIYVGGWLN